MNPWFAQLLDGSGHVPEEGRWDYGVATNRAAVDTFLRYHHEQGLSRHLFTSADVFPAELLNS